MNTEMKEYRLVCKYWVYVLPFDGTKDELLEAIAAAFAEAENRDDGYGRYGKPVNYDLHELHNAIPAVRLREQGIGETREYNVGQYYMYMDGVTFRPKRVAAYVPDIQYN